MPSKLLVLQVRPSGPPMTPPMAPVKPESGSKPSPAPALGQQPYKGYLNVKAQAGMSSALRPAQGHKAQRRTSSTPVSSETYCSRAMAGCFCPSLTLC